MSVSVQQKSLHSPGQPPAAVRRFGGAALALRAMITAAVTGSLLFGPSAYALPTSTIITPTVFPVLTPTTPIDLPLQVAADHSDVWISGTNIQHIFLQGHVQIRVGYRRLSADAASVRLRPIRGGGTGVFAATIYLQGHVRISEGVKGQAISKARELLVTTRVLARIELAGSAPLPKNESKNPVVMRGAKLRRQLATRPKAVPFVPTIEIQKTELALREGWITRSASGVIQGIPSPVIHSVPTPRELAHKHVPKAPASPPRIFATGNHIEVRTIGNQRITVARGNFYLVRQTVPGQPPLELRADNAVLFSPLGQKEPGPASGKVSRIARSVAGVYLQGDVSVTDGYETMHASRVYYDLTTNRAILLNAVLSDVDVQTKSPLYIRAKEILQFAQGRLEAKSARLSTDEFYDPHYYIGASSMTLRNITPASVTPGPHRKPVYAYTAQNVIFAVHDVPLFYWPYLAGDTRHHSMALRSASVGFSNIYGTSVRTDWDLLDLLGYHPPFNLHADGQAVYYSNRGFGGGINAYDQAFGGHGSIQSFLIDDHGTDDLGNNRTSLPLLTHTRGYISARYMQRLSEQWTVSLEGAYFSDPNFLEQYFDYRYETDTEHQTSVYLKQQHDTEGLTILGKWNLNNFVTNADLEDDEFTVQKTPEVQYWREGDPLLGIFTYYSQSSGGLVNDQFSQSTPAQRGLQTDFPGMNQNETFQQYYLNNGWTDQNVARLDSRQEIDMPLSFGALHVVPYVTGRLTYWDSNFSSNQVNGSTTRAWGAVGLRASTTFWKVYRGFNSNFLDVHQLRHIIQPEVDVFVSGSNVQQGYLQPFDRNVEGITDASGAEFALRQTLQTKRGSPGHEQIVDWMTFNVSADMFWNKSAIGPFSSNNPIYAGGPFSTSDYGQPLVGYYDFSQPELSQLADSINANATWRAGANVRLLGDESYNVDLQELETADAGVMVDQSPSISYFLGNRYINAVNSDQWTFSINYKLTRKYAISATESYDFYLAHNIISAVTIVRKLSHFYTALSLSYNADTASEAVFVNIWPAGYPRYGITSPSALQAVQQ